MRARKRQADRRVVCTVAVILVAATLVLSVDIAEKQSARIDPRAQTTEQAAKQAGAAVTPTNPNRYP